MAPKAPCRGVIFTTLRSLVVGAVLAQCGCDRVLQSPAGVVNAPNPDLAVPIIEFSTTKLDLGEVPANLKEPATASFTFRNMGGSPLRIEELTKDCLCATAEVVPPIVASGSNGVVRLELRRESPRSSAATITLRSNDPISPLTQLSVKWHVVGPLEFEPVSLDFGNIVPFGSEVALVRLFHRFKADEAGASTFEKIVCEPAEILSAHVKACTAPSETCEVFELVVALDSDAAPGEHWGWVHSPIGSGAGAISLPVRWYVRPTVEASPSELYLGSGRAGETVEKAVVVSSEASAGDLDVSTVEIRPDDGTLSVVATATSKHAIVFTTKASLAGPTGARRWEIVVNCNRPIAQSVTIATSAYVSPSSAGID